MALVSEIITDVGHSLRNQSSEFSDTELKAYLDRAHNFLYTMLVKEENELILTGSDSFNTEVGKQDYTLTSSGVDVNDLLLVSKIWISTYEPMSTCFEEDLYEAINLEEDSSTGSRSRPESYCQIGDTIWFETVPDAIYSVNLKYFPVFTATAGTTSDMPFNNIFNQSILQATTMYARDRNEMRIDLNVQLMELFKTESNFMLRKRSKKNVRFSFDKRLRR